MKNELMQITREEKKHLKEFEKLLGYSFKKRERLKRALTHKSYANELKLPMTEHNERYEYLGDAVLELSISSLLMKIFPLRPEGDLSKIRAAIVNEESLSQMADLIKLGGYMYLGKGEEQTGGRTKASLLSDAYEAVLGAIFLDRGFDKAFAIVAKHFSPVLKQAGSSTFLKDYKTKLQEEVQGRFRVMPRYKLVNTAGPEHQKVFEINLYIRDELYGRGKGPSKKAAEQEAARQALEKLNGI